jgi:hypothetical protein
MASVTSGSAGFLRVVVRAREVVVFPALRGVLEEEPFLDAAELAAREERLPEAGFSSSAGEVLDGGIKVKNKWLKAERSRVSQTACSRGHSGAAPGRDASGDELHSGSAV